MKVRSSSFQYQLDPGGDEWIFRYDYLRNPPEPYPASHLQIRGMLIGLRDLNLERVHFPTQRSPKARLCSWASITGRCPVLADLRHENAV